MPAFRNLDRRGGCPAHKRLALWLTVSATDGSNYRCPGWLKAISPSVLFGCLPQIAPTVREVSWIVTQGSESATLILNWLEDLYNLLCDGGWLWIGITSDLQTTSATKTRWEWLAQLAVHQGFSCLDRELLEVEGQKYLVLRKVANSKTCWRLRSPETADAESCKSLFKATFGFEMSSDLWNWKYGNEQARSVIAFRQDRLVAHYGCVTRRVCMYGRNVNVLQICDVMVDIPERGILAHKGAFYQVARATQEIFIGFGGNHEFCYGFPNLRANRLGERLNLYAEIERIMELQWTQPALGKRMTNSHAEIMTESNFEAAQINNVWHQMSQQMVDRILVVRNSDYWLDRYVHHPLHKYRILSVRSNTDGLLLGVVVLKVDENECKMIDILAPPENMPILVDHARFEAKVRGLMLKAWITSGCAPMLACESSEVTSTEIVIPLNVHAMRLDMTELVGKWFLMMGDTDFL